MRFLARQPIRGTSRPPIIQQTFSIPESDRIANLVMAALEAQFKAPGVAHTWLHCIEAHIAHFLRVAQLPVEFVSVALSLLRNVSQLHPKLCADGSTAELIFMVTMVHVAEKAYTTHSGIAQTYDLRGFEFVDRRWGADTWKVAFDEVTALLDDSWASCSWNSLENLHLIMEGSPPVLQKEQGLGIFIGTQGVTDETRRRSAQAEHLGYFNKIFVGNSESASFTGDDSDSTLCARSGPLVTPAADIVCTDHRCILATKMSSIRGKQLSLFYDELTHAPWTEAYTSLMSKRVSLKSTCTLALFTHGGLHKAIHVAKSKHRADSDLEFVNQVTEGLYQRSCIFYARERGGVAEMIAEERGIEVAPFMKVTMPALRVGGWSEFIGRVGLRMRVGADRITMYSDLRRSL